MTDDVEQARAARRARLEHRIEAGRKRDRRIIIAAVFGLGLMIATKVPFDLNRPTANTAHRPSAPSDASVEDLRASGRGARRLSLLNDRADFVLEKDGRVVWTAGGEARYEVAHLSSHGLLVLHTNAGLLNVPPALWREGEDGPPPDLDVLIAHAVAAGFSLAGAHLVAAYDGPLRIESRQFRIVPGGPMRVDPNAKVRTASADLGLRQRLASASKAYIQGLQETSIDEATQKATATLLAALAERGGNHWADLKPEVTRRLIRHGWLQQVGVAEPETSALKEAVLEATRMRPARVLRGAGGSFIRYTNIFGRRVEVLQTSEGTWYTCPQPSPQWLGTVTARAAVIELPPGSAVLEGIGQPMAATLYIGKHRAGTWRVGNTLELDQALWQRWVSGKIGNRKNTPADLFPGHIVIGDIQGDTLALVTTHGTVRPARDGQPAEMQRFFDECAVALPNAAHMDLVGEVLYNYAWDTAEYDRPLLIGTETYNGDIHQTAAQTLATCCGGLYRGDCDDLACFFHALTTHQGRNAHVLSLPHHLANAYAEEGDDGTWTVSVLHTGPPIEVQGATLDTALLKTYEHFASHESIDLNALPISLRFGGDAVRERYLLPSEIFANRTYGQGLVAVQAAYRFHTYLSGIETMRAIRASRKKPSAADHRELAHLLRWAGRYADAVEPFEKAFAAAHAPASRVDGALDLLATLVETGPRTRVDALATQLEEELIPAFERAQAGRLLQPWLRLGTALLASEHHRERGLGYLAVQARARAEPSLGAIEAMAARKNFNPRWLHYRGMPRHTTNMDRYVTAALAGLRETRTDATPLTRSYRAAVDHVLRRWFLRVAFRTVHGNASVLTRYAALASFYEALLGPEALAALVMAAGPAGADDVRQASAPAGIDVREHPAGLRLIHTAAGYRRAAWWRLFTAEAEAFDAVATRRAMTAELVALDSAAHLGQGHHTDPTAQLFVRIALAVLDGDPQTAKTVLAEIAERRDHTLRDQVAALLGAAARRHSVARYRALLEVWSAALDHAPNYFEVAWAAQRAGFPAHARAAAQHAVARHPSRPEFATELKHLTQENKRK